MDRTHSCKGKELDAQEAEALAWAIISDATDGRDALAAPERMPVPPDLPEALFPSVVF